jgi:hypothetical protein
MVPRRKTTATACVLVLVAAFVLAACGNADKKQGVDEPAREGLSLPLDGIQYNVFITRELNLRIPPDNAYYKGPEAPQGQALYGIFVQACNNTARPHPTARTFKVLDNQGDSIEPKPLPTDNAFAYNPRVLQPKQCEPEAGSVAQQGPTAGSMLLFQFPLDFTENRPLQLEIESNDQALATRRAKLTIDLDL